MSVSPFDRPDDGSDPNPPVPPPSNYPPPPDDVGGTGYSGPGRDDADWNSGLPPTLTVGGAISFGWNTFKSNAGVWIGVAAIAAVVQIVLNFVFGGAGRSTDMSDAFSVWSIVGTIVSAIVGYLIHAALVRGALHEIDGRRPTIGSFFQFGNVAAIILASILVVVMVTVGFVLLIIPGIVLLFLTWWTLQFVVDRNDDALTAVTSSMRAISSHAGTLTLLALALTGINILGLIPCGLGLFVTVPITIIASTYAYRVVSHNTRA